MRIEIRNDSVRIDGYVNVVERDSKILRNQKGDFVEKIKAGAFQRALDRAEKTGYDVKILLNHDYTRQLSSAKAAKTSMVEDGVGLRCTCEIQDAEVVEKAKTGKLTGWSFGFMALQDAWEKNKDGVAHREVRELELKEVSILDESKKPAYIGTSIETREDFVEVRAMNDMIEFVEKKAKSSENYKYHNKLLTIRANG